MSCIQLEVAAKKFARAKKRKIFAKISSFQRNVFIIIRELLILVGNALFRVFGGKKYPPDGLSLYFLLNT